MSNTINPLGASRPDLQRSVSQADPEEDGQRGEHNRTDIAFSKTQGKGKMDRGALHEKVDPSSDDQAASPDPNNRLDPNFGVTLDDAIDRTDEINAANQHALPNLEGLSQAEQQLIYRYFPESPSLELRLYKPDMSTDKVDPGSVGSRVDIRG